MEGLIVLWGESVPGIRIPEEFLARLKSKREASDGRHGEVVV